MAVGEVGRDLDPLPALGADRHRRLVELLGHHHVDQADVLQPPTRVALEQVVQHRATRLLVGRDADELRALVRSANRALGQHSADGVALLVVGLGEPLEHLLLAGVVAVDGERHQLVERQPVLGIDVEQLGADRREPQALLDHRHRHELAGGDLLLGLALLAQGQEGPELVERVQRRALDVLGERVLLGQAVGAHDAGHGRVAGQTLLLGEQRQRPVAPAAGGDLEHAGLGARRVDDGAHAQAHEQAATGDVLGKLLDRDACLDVADVGLAQHQLVERDVARRRQGDLLDRFGHGRSP